MELFIFLGYVIPALIVVILVGYEFYRQGVVTVSDVFIGIFSAVVPAYNIVAILCCGYDYLRRSNFIDKVLWVKKQ